MGNSLDELKVDIALARETAKAAHSRMDKFEVHSREDSAKIQGALDRVNGKLDVLNEYMHRSKGWTAAALTFGGILGAALSKILEHFLK